MTDNKRNNEYKEFLKRFDENHQSVNDEPGASSAIHRTQSNFHSKRKAAKKRRQRHMMIIIVIPAAVMLLSIILIVKSCSGGDILKGTWDLDGVTVYQFDGKGNGLLNLPSNAYPFIYEIKDNEVSIDFESDAARDAAYSFSVKDGVLTMIGGEGTIGGTYELKKVSD